MCDVGIRWRGRERVLTRRRSPLPEPAFEVLCDGDILLTLYVWMGLGRIGRRWSGSTFVGEQRIGGLDSDKEEGVRGGVKDEIWRRCGSEVIDGCVSKQQQADVHWPMRDQLSDTLL